MNNMNSVMAMSYGNGAMDTDKYCSDRKGVNKNKMTTISE